MEPADAENVAALVRELHMPRLTWAEACSLCWDFFSTSELKANWTGCLMIFLAQVLLEHVFPWAGALDHAS